MLNRKKIRSLHDVMMDHADAEFIYLRENDLTRFNPDVKLESLRVLDLSINDIGGTVNFLDRTPHLHHLYLTGNKIDSLVGISNLSSLETLCLSDNNINGFEGLENLPNLRVLSLNFNNIASFNAYPKLPSLHTLNLVGNPITDVASYRSIAVAVNNADLVSIDGNPVQEEERAAVAGYPGKVVHCIRHGYIVDEDGGSEAAAVEESAHAYLQKIQTQRNASQPLQLRYIRLTSNSAEGESARKNHHRNREDVEESGGSENESDEAGGDAGRNQAHHPHVYMEGVPIHLEVCMQDVRSQSQRTSDIFHSRHLYSVIFELSGEATEVFVVGSMNHWGEPIELERSEEENGEVCFRTTLYLPVGDYEYRYIVDGVEKVSEANRVKSRHNQGFCNLYQVTELKNNQYGYDGDEDEEQDTLLHVRWMRSDPATGVFELMDSTTGLDYTPTLDDVGSCLRAEVLAYVEGMFAFLYYDITTPIQPASPCCTHLAIQGEAVEGSVLMAEAVYHGGVEGHSALTWYRVYPDGREVAVEQRDPWAGYKVCGEDTGCRVRAVFTPVRQDWTAGKPTAVTTEVVACGTPECESIKIMGTLVEGSPLQCKVVYTGGREGSRSAYQWLRGVPGTEEFVPIEGENDTVYVPCIDDVGTCLAVEYTPANEAGVEGETCRCVLENPIEAGAPEITNLVISGEMQSGHVLMIEYDYTGGEPGEHLIQWFSRDADHHQSRIGQPNSEYLTLSNNEIDHTIEVVVTPIREDGMRGKPEHARSSGVVRPGTDESNDELDAEAAADEEGEVMQEENEMTAEGVQELHYDPVPPAQ